MSRIDVSVSNGTERNDCEPIGIKNIDLSSETFKMMNNTHTKIKIELVNNNDH